MLPATLSHIFCSLTQPLVDLRTVDKELKQSYCLCYKFLAKHTKIQRDRINNCAVRCVHAIRYLTSSVGNHSALKFIERVVV